MKKVPSQEVCRCDGTEKMRVHNRESVIEFSSSFTCPANEHPRRKEVFTQMTT